MSESAKTLSLVGVAVVLVLIATFGRAHLTSGQSEGNVGQALFPEWTDPAAVRSLQITNVDETTNELNDFKVADIDGRWVVPSHDNYPANAEDHVFKAATSLIGLKVLAVVSDTPGDQETYGVVEPSEKTLTSSSFAGFGRLVVVKDSAGKDLARLIVGKEDKSHGEGGPSNLRFVRRAGQDRIYRVSLDTDVLTTKFQDWVDTDILALKQHWDINSLLLRDYALDDNAIVRKDDVDLAFDESKANWTVKKLTEFKANKPEVTKLPADEELDSTKINDMKTNLSGMKLDDVARKPAGFSEKLKSGKDYLSDHEAQESLARLQFYPVPEDKPTDIFSAGGDMTVGMKDGVEYTVRFGRSGFSFKNDTGDKKSTAKNAKHTSAERFVFVTARFNPDLIPKPVLKPLPEAKKPDVKKPDETKPAETKPETKTSEPKKPDEKTPEVKTPETKAPDAKTPEKKPADETPPAPKADGSSSEKKPDAKPSDKSADPTKSSQTKSHLSGELLALADPADDVKKPDDSKKPDAPKATNDKVPADKAPADTKTDDKKSPDVKADDNKKPAETKPADKKPAETKPADKSPGAKKPAAEKPAAEKPKSDTQLADEEAARDAERKQIETENRRAQDQYDETVKKGKAHAKELNNRFADWYYLISEDDYKKVHLGLNDIVKKKPESETGGGLGPLPKSPFDGGVHLPHP